MAAFFALGCAAPEREPGPEPVFQRNRNALLSEDDAAALALEEALTGFMTEIDGGLVSKVFVEPEDIARDRFFFKALLREQPEGCPPPSVLKSYSPNGISYRITVAFAGTTGGEPNIDRIVELNATPHGDSFRFRSPFLERTSDMAVSQIGDVTFHHVGALDTDEARAFVAQRVELFSLTETQRPPLHYYSFRTLDELLTAYGLIFDARRCNFLAEDLGFGDDSGRRYVTGTGDANYMSGYVEMLLEGDPENADDLYPPLSIGMATYYGGYGLSGDDMAELKSQFRKEVHDNPGIDFLVEFRKGRGSSVNRHFSHFVIGGFLIEEAIETRGFKAALQLVYSGANGERFFERLDAILGVNEGNFHATILRRIR